MFNKYKEPYEKALKNSGFNKILEYSSQNQNDDTDGGKRRKKQVLYYNKPFNSTVKTKIRK